MGIREELADCTIDELELIVESQNNAYSNEEMQIVEQVLKEKQNEYKQMLEKRLPKEIDCPKCEGPNDFKNDVCVFCGCTLNKEKYYSESYYNELIEEEQKNVENEGVNSERSYTFHFIISFLIPIVGIITGAIMLSSDNARKCSAGKTCILLSIVSIFIAIFVLFM